jgi:uncharacterized protein (DUF1501 family)
MQRRTLLKLAGASLLMPSMALAGPTDKHLVVVLLRGGVDGLSVLPPVGDPLYRKVRGDLALDDALKLDGFFGLHPSMEALLPLWKAGQMLGIHATALPYRKRSHFDAQDLLETAGGGDGWLNRALHRIDDEGLALGPDLPLLLRGEAAVSSMDPGRQVPEDDEVLDLVLGLYADDPVLGPALAAALETHESMDVPPAPEKKGKKRRGTDVSRIAAVAAELLRGPDAPRALVIDTAGWDTHARQRGVLEVKLRGLAEGLAALADGLGPTWARTTVLVVTEFGRTAAPNGTKGTDHGTASCALVLGGAIDGGRVIADWPGLDSLHEGRDLAPTTHLHAVFAGALAASIGGEDVLDVSPLKLA